MHGPCEFADRLLAFGDRIQVADVDGPPLVRMVADFIPNGAAAQPSLPEVPRLEPNSALDMPIRDVDVPRSSPVRWAGLVRPASALPIIPTPVPERKGLVACAHRGEQVRVVGQAL